MFDIDEILKMKYPYELYTGDRKTAKKEYIKKEDEILGKKLMKIRMRKVLSLFAENKNKNLVLDAYGCGVFRNDPDIIADYWHELLYDENYISYFDNIIFAVFDNSKTQSCIRAFEKLVI